MIKGFQEDRIDVLTNLYGYFVTQDAGRYVSAIDLKRRTYLLLSSSYITLLLEDLQSHGLVDGEVGSADDDIYTLNQKGLLEAEEAIRVRGLTLDQFAVDFSRRVDAGLIIDTSSPDVAMAKAKLDELADRLRTDNDVGEITPEQREVAIAEVGELRETLNKPHVRANYVWTKANEVLLWITEKGAGAAIGELAKSALHHIQSFISVFFN